MIWQTGIQEGMIDKIDGEYIKVLNSLGISQEEIEKSNITKNYASIIRKLQIAFTTDVIQNSSANAIRMSDEMSRLMHEFRNINNKRIVSLTILQEDKETYPVAIRQLMDRFANIIHENSILEQLKFKEFDLEFAKSVISKYEGTPDEEFAKFILQVTPEEYAFTEEMILKASRKSIEYEQAEARRYALSGEEFVLSQEFPYRDARIQSHIRHYKSIGITEDYPEESIRKDAETELAAQSHYIELYPNFRDKMALEFGARYLATLNDIEFLNLIRSVGIITEKKAASLTRTYKEIGEEGLRKEVSMQRELKEIIQEQVEETEKIGSTPKVPDER